MIATAIQTGHLIVYITDDSIDDSTVAAVRESMPGARVLTDVLEPLYDAAISTREAAQRLGRLKAELELTVESGVRVAVVCRRRTQELGTRSHFLASLCALADRVHFLKST